MRLKKLFAARRNFQNWRTKWCTFKHLLANSAPFWYLLQNLFDLVSLHLSLERKKETAAEHSDFDAAKAGSTLLAPCSREEFKSQVPWAMNLYGQGVFKETA